MKTVAFGVCPRIDTSLPIKMDRKNATVLFFIRFVTDYGKDNSYFNVCPCVDTSQPIKDES